MALPTYFFTLFLLLSSLSLGAQISPPDFQCTRNDTLQWVNIPNACGPYLSTHVMSAPDAAGPYTEIAVLTDPTQTTFHDPNPTGAIRFYYLFYRYDCPSQAVLNSDTLNNLIPTPPASTWVSEEEGVFILHWTPASSPETSGYRIYRQAPEGFVIIGEVSGATTTTYTDNSLADYSPGTAYRVTAIDPCGNNSLFGPEVRTPGLMVEGGIDCTSAVSITPLALAAASSPRPFTSLALYAAVNGAPFQEVATFAPETTSLSYTEGNDGESICFYVEASVQGDPRPLRTPIQCTDINIVQPIRNLDIYGAGFTSTADLQLDFNWDNLAAVQEISLLFQTAAGSLTTLLIPFDGLTGPVASLVVPAANLPDRPYTLSLRGEDICTNVVLSNSVAPVFLSGGLNGTGVNQLSWTALQAGPTATDVQYELSRIALDGSRAVLTTGSGQSFSDAVGVSDPNLALSCYQATATVGFEDGSQRTYRSNTVCLEQQASIYFPNIFSVQASSILNREFCPGFSRSPTGAYQLDIYDRWGGHVFSTTNPSDCWRGEARGQLVESGVYIYVLKMEVSGELATFSGDVTFLR